eukprot:gb/GFBE01022938.1/.p1 GENE.gb/GFBE01022938.1/~~gb/GFBE01022938.1/.p1  ORF type:complete len:198 (+),score=23.74 gb/GFBE01022938.1/:1-594(+)
MKAFQVAAERDESRQSAMTQDYEIVGFPAALLRMLHQLPNLFAIRLARLLYDALTRQSAHQAEDNCSHACAWPSLFGRHEVAQPSDSCCAICLEEILAEAAPTRLRCGHVFHRECVGRWLQYGTGCPYRCSQPAWAQASDVHRLDRESSTQDVHDARTFVASSRRREAAAAACQRLGLHGTELKKVLKAWEWQSWWG